MTEVKFESYRFNREQLILYKDNELIPLKRNQALLLDFFLSSPESIHSKDDILDNVWRDKVVSEQVVFQTISQLRSIFGDKAI
ncbi:MAG: winged helix-turn-helix domain-containing protein, partial [Kangiellaceae bacterium]|nr:winged helix-turn-helix domain-containing protein [Kangiellaceae bacterium]